MDLTERYRKSYPNTKECTFSAPPKTFFQTDHLLGHKASLNRYKEIEITSCILSDHHKLKLDINSNRSSRNFTNSWKLNNSLLNERWFKTEIKKEIKDLLRLNENEYIAYQTYGHNGTAQESSSQQ